MAKSGDWDAEEFSSAIKKAGEEIAAKLNKIAVLFNSSAAINNMMNGDVGEAERVLREFDLDSLRLLALAAQGLSTLANEIIAEAEA